MLPSTCFDREKEKREERGRNGREGCERKRAEREEEREREEREGKRDVVCRVEILFTLQLLEYFTISNHPRLAEGEDTNSRRRCGGEREGEEGVWGRGRGRE